jgi:biopolymer transport protein ExbD
VSRLLFWLFLGAVGCAAKGKHGGCSTEPPIAVRAEESASWPQPSKERQIHVVDANVTLDGQPIATTELAVRLSNRDRVFVTSDGATPFGNLNRVFSELLAANKLMVGVTFAGAVQQLELEKQGFYNESEEPTLLIVVVRDGISLKGPGGNVASGCQEPGPGLAIPRKEQEQNYEAMAACVRRLETLAGIARYRLMADTSIPFSEVNSVVTALSSAGVKFVGLRIP